jgi:hypothetical protein
MYYFPEIQKLWRLIRQSLWPNPINTNFHLPLPKTHPIPWSTQQTPMLHIVKAREGYHIYVLHVCSIHLFILSFIHNCVVYCVFFTMSFLHLQTLTSCPPAPTSGFATVFYISFSIYNECIFSLRLIKIHHLSNAPLHI